jgi:hypothetical protein
MDQENLNTKDAKTSELIKYIFQFNSLIEDRRMFIKVQEQSAKKRVIPFTQINEAKAEIKAFEKMLFILEEELNKRIPIRS